MSLIIETELYFIFDGIKKVTSFHDLRGNKSLVLCAKVEGKRCRWFVRKPVTEDMPRVKVQSEFKQC